VEIRGDNFVDVKDVKFNGVSDEPRYRLVASRFFLETRVPQGAGDGRITVETGGGPGMSGMDFKVTIPPPPDIDFFFPESGAAGTQVTLVGKNLISFVQVLFGDKPGVDPRVESEVGDEQRIVVNVPSDAPTGQIKITVTATGGTKVSDKEFTVTGAATETPKIATVEPDFGPLFGGTLITITGKNFAAGSKVRVGDNAATSVTVLDPRQDHRRDPARPRVRPL
jgi:hypothetical protein